MSGMLTIENVLLFCSAFWFQAAVSLECYNCSNINDVNNCASTTTCPSGQSCYLNANAIGNTLGCIENQNCGSPSLIVGRNLDINTHYFKSGHWVRENDINERDANHCFECCSLDFCNKVLCGYPKPTSCIDDPKVDCAWLNSKFNVCQIIHEAKTVCPRFCGLCLLVDGNWAEWSAWSACQVTCGGATQTRTRQCSNPAPASGGLNCPGSDMENKQCALDTCPVDGNWEHWLSWSSCDVTCGNGSQSRTRRCNNPEPAYNGRNCSGQPVEYKQCSQPMCPIDGNWEHWLSWSSCDVTCGNGSQSRTRRCNNPEPAYNGRNCSGHPLEYKHCSQQMCPINGGWALWLPWEACSVTCDIGIQRRHRTCSNPIPQYLGENCFGDTMDVTLCLSGSCADGGWSMWGTWSSCSGTCGAGIKSRTRTCTNPRPSVLGRQCDGESLQDASCNHDDCLTPTVAFQAHKIQNLSLSVSGTFVFTITTVNAGDGYNTSSGNFTAPLAGTCYFSTQICIPGRKDQYTRFNIVHNHQAVTKTISIGNSVNVECYHADGIVVLRLHDRVWVEHIDGSGFAYQSSDTWNMFSGSLLHL